MFTTKKKNHYYPDHYYSLIKMGLAGLVQIEARSSCRAGGGLGAGGMNDGGGKGRGLNSMKSEKCGAF